MSDKELLMMAAKAAGIDGYYVDSFVVTDFYAGQSYCGPNRGIVYKSECFDVCWSPLTDDGDALRLAVKLKFDVMTRWGEAYSAVLDRDGVFTIQLDTDLDMCAATRRAIVRAAAEIGSKL